MLHQKRFLVPALLLAASAGVLLILIKTPLVSVEYTNVLVHSAVLLAYTCALFFVYFFSYQDYVKDKEICCYFVSLAFYTLGIIGFVHAVSVPSFGWGNEKIFDVSEHYGLFLTSLLLWGLMFPFSKQIQEKIYRARSKIFLGANLLLLAGVALLFILPSLAGALFGVVNIIIALTGVNFFVLLLALLTRKEENFFNSVFLSTLALLAASTIPPLFYHEWDLSWWYVHLLELVAVLLLLRLLWVKKGRVISEISFASLSIRTRLFFIVGFMLLAITLNGAIDFRLSQSHLQTQTLENLVITADLQEGQVLTWLEKLKGRAVDFSSDGFIRTELNKILSGDRQAVTDLSRHLSENKLPLDPAIFGIHVMDLNGKVVASSQGNEVGTEDMAQDEVFVEAKGSRYANAYVSDIMETSHFGKKNIAILATAPIIDQTRKENIGVIMLFFKTQELSDILTGAAQTQSGALSTWTTRKKTMEMYMVNEDGLMISESKFVENASLEQKVESQPVRLCAKSEEMSGEYINYQGVSVLGASMCFNNGWILLTEINKDEVFGTLSDYLQQNLLSGSATFLIILLVLFLFIIGITDPLSKLSDMAKKISHGDFTARITLITKDEFGQLSHAFNQMVENLQKSSLALQKKVMEEETNRLAVSNILGDLEVEKKRVEIFAQDLEKFKLAIESTTEQVIITDRDGTVLYGNPAIEKLTGYTVTEAVGMKAGKLWGGHMGKLFYERMWKTILVDKKTFTGELINKRKNGEEYIASIIISSIRDESGDVRFFVAVERDVTKEREIDKAKTEFVSLASHQLRTPLTSINWYVEMLQGGDAGKLNDKQKEFLSEVYTGSQRMVGLVDALLNVSRLEMGTFVVEPEPTDVLALMRSVIDEQKPQLEERKMKLGETYADNLPKLNSDPKLLRMVFQNLLSNAIKYTPEKGVIAIDIHLVKRGELVDSQKANDDSIVVVVSDSGYGIPKSQQDKIFTKLFRADNVREKDTEGTGLGLYVAKSIIDHSGGQIWFESEENKSTTFYVTLPLAGMKKKEGTRALS